MLIPIYKNKFGKDIKRLKKRGTGSVEEPPRMTNLH